MIEADWTTDKKGLQALAMALILDAAENIQAENAYYDESVAFLEGEGSEIWCDIIGCQHEAIQASVPRIKKLTSYEVAEGQEVFERFRQELTWNGVTKPIYQWSRDQGIKAHLIIERLKRGWSLDRALTQKQQVKFHRNYDLENII